MSVSVAVAGIVTLSQSIEYAVEDKEEIAGDNSTAAASENQGHPALECEADMETAGVDPEANE